MPFQQVASFLSAQGILFYVPHWIWKNWEEGKIRMITDGVRGAVIGGNNEERKERRKRLVQYISDTLHMHNMYALGYFFCEFLNFLNVVSISVSDSDGGGAVAAVTKFWLNFFKCPRSRVTVSQHGNYRLVFGRHIHDVRYEGAGIRQHEPRESNRPHDRNISSRHKVHIPQIRSYRHHTTA